MRLRVSAYLLPALVVVVLILLTVVMIWPVAAQLGRQIPGSDGDAYVHLWTARWVRDSLQAGRGIFFTDQIFHPVGTPLYWHNFAWFNILIWLLLQAFLNEATAYSLIFLGIIVFNGFATYLLAREVTGSQPASFVACIIVAFWPFTLSNHHHPNLILIGWVPLALLYLMRLMQKQRLVDALIFAVFVALIGISRWQMLVIGGLLLFIYFLYCLATQPQIRTYRLLKLTLLTGLISLLIMLPLLWPLLSAQFSRAYPEDLFAVTEGYHSDFLAYFIPSRYHPIWGQLVFERFYSNFGVSKVFVPFLGFTTLLLAVYGAIRQFPKARFWILATFLYIVLALGSDLVINGQPYLPLPYRLLDDISLFRMIRNPERFNVILSIPVALLAALGVQSLMQRQNLSHIQSWLLWVLVVGFILFEYAVTYPMLPLTVPQWFSQLANEEEDFAILNLPMHNRRYIENYMYYQSEHGKPLVGGKTARTPREAFEFIDSVPSLSRSPKTNAPPDEIAQVGSQLKSLADANVRYLILHKNFLTVEELDSWKEWLGLEPVFEDAELVVFGTSITIGEDVPMIDTGIPGLGLIKHSVTPVELRQGMNFIATIHWASNQAITEDYDVCLQVVNTEQIAVQEVCQAISTSWPTSNWDKDEIVFEEYSMNMSPYLDGGDYSIELFVFPDGESQNRGETIKIGNVNYLTLPRESVFDPDDIYYMAVAHWGESLALIEFDVNQDVGEMLSVDLRWGALKRIGESYKVFLHLVNNRTGELAAQVDSIPMKWTYPTNWWEEGEIVEDTIQLSTESVEPGSYQLWLGWYDESSGQRLLVTQSDQLTEKREDAFLLEEFP